MIVFIVGYSKSLKSYNKVKNSIHGKNVKLKIMSLYYFCFFRYIRESTRVENAPRKIPPKNHSADCTYGAGASAAAAATNFSAGNSVGIIFSCKSGNDATTVSK